jgi:hypothetical protein
MVMGWLEEEGGEVERDCTGKGCEMAAPVLHRTFYTRNELTKFKKPTLFIIFSLVAFHREKKAPLVLIRTNVDMFIMLGL